MLVLHPAWSRPPGARLEPSCGLVLAVNAAIAWTVILIHDFAHLATARAEGAPARITLGTRLQPPRQPD